MTEINEEIDIDMADDDRKPVVINVSGGVANVSVNVRNYQYPEWLDQMVQDHVRWEEG